MIIHYSCTRQFLVALVFADSYPLSFHEMIFGVAKLEHQGALKTCIYAYVGTYTQAHMIAECTRNLGGAMASFNDSAGRLKIYAKLFLTGKHKGCLGQKAHRVSPYSRFM